MINSDIRSCLLKVMVLFFFLPFLFKLVPDIRCLICMFLDSLTCTVALTIPFFFLLSMLHIDFRLSQIHGFGSVDLKSMQAKNSKYIIPPTSRSSNNSIALRFCGPPRKTVSRVQILMFTYLIDPCYSSQSWCSVCLCSYDLVGG